jgi:hypothetical protein
MTRVRRGSPGAKGFAMICFSELRLIWVGCHLLFMLPSTCEVHSARSRGVQRGGVLISLDGETSMGPDRCTFFVSFLSFQNLGCVEVFLVLLSACMTCIATDTLELFLVPCLSLSLSCLTHYFTWYEALCTSCCYTSHAMPRLSTFPMVHSKSPEV